MSKNFSATYEGQRTRRMSVLIVCPAQLHSQNRHRKVKLLAQVCITIHSDTQYAAFQSYVTWRQVSALNVGHHQAIIGGTQKYVQKDLQVIYDFKPTCCVWLIMYIFTYSMVQSPSWEANWFAASQDLPRIFMEPEGSLTHSQASATCPYPGPAQSSPHTHIPPPGDPS